MYLHQTFTDCVSNQYTHTDMSTCQTCPQVMACLLILLSFFVNFAHNLRLFMSEMLYLHQKFINYVFESQHIKNCLHRFIIKINQKYLLIRNTIYESLTKIQHFRHEIVFYYWVKNTQKCYKINDLTVTSDKIHVPTSLYVKSG